MSDEIQGEEKDVRRKYRREFVMTEIEAAELRKKAEKACMSESMLIRLLIDGYNPPEAPGDEFHDDMTAIIEGADKLYTLAEKASDPETKKLLKEAYADLRILRMRIQKKYLSGERSKDPWL